MAVMSPAELISRLLLGRRRSCHWQGRVSPVLSLARFSNRCRTLLSGRACGSGRVRAARGGCDGSGRGFALLQPSVDCAFGLHSAKIVLLMVFRLAARSHPQECFSSLPELSPTLNQYHGEAEEGLACCKSCLPFCPLCTAVYRSCDWQTDELGCSSCNLGSKSNAQTFAKTSLVKISSPVGNRAGSCPVGSRAATLFATLDAAGLHYIRSSCRPRPAVVGQLPTACSHTSSKYGSNLYIMHCYGRLHLVQVPRTLRPVAPSMHGARNGREDRVRRCSGQLGCVRCRSARLNQGSTEEMLRCSSL